MRAVIQRVEQASVEIGGEAVGAIQQGLLVFVGVAAGDSQAEAAYLVEKICNMRIFEDEDGRFNRSVKDVGGGLLIVSQFTLMADCSKGRRPSLDKAAPPQDAERLYNLFVDLARMSGIMVSTGRFQAHMIVRIANDGPVTIIIDRPPKTQNIQEGQ